MARYPRAALFSLLLAGSALTPSFLAAQDATAETAQIEKWQPYLQGALPKPEELPPLLSDLSDLLGSLDPKLRDDTAYLLLGRWILTHNLVPKDDCVRLWNTWISNLGYRLDASPEQRDEAAVRRSFSALSLVLLVEHDIQHPFLRDGAFDQLVARTTDYLRLEPDERGYVAGLGWVHPTAHAADLLRRLAKNKRLQARQHAQILDSITHRLQRLKLAFTAGEDDRLARAIVELALRPDFDTATLKDWLTSIVNLPAAGPQEQIVTFGHNRRLVVQATMIRLLLLPEQNSKVAASLDVVRQALAGKLRKPR